MSKLIKFFFGILKFSVVPVRAEAERVAPARISPRPNLSPQTDGRRKKRSINRDRKQKAALRILNGISAKRLFYANRLLYAEYGLDEFDRHVDVILANGMVEFIREQFGHVAGGNDEFLPDRIEIEDDGSLPFRRSFSRGKIFPEHARFLNGGQKALPYI